MMCLILVREFREKVTIDLSLERLVSFVKQKTRDRAVQEEKIFLTNLEGPRG